jgi:PAS domain S-box-containing protein
MRRSSPSHLADVSTINRNILTPLLVAGFVAIIGVLILARVIGAVNLRDVYDTSGAVAHTNATKAALQQLLATLIDAETGERGFILLGEPTYLEPYDRAIRAIPSDLSQVRALTADNGEQQADLDQLSRLTEVRLEELAMGIQARRESGLTAAQAVVATTGKRTMDEMRAIVSRMEGREDTLLAARSAQAARSYRIALLIAYLTSGVALLVVAALLASTWRAGKERVFALETAERLQVTLASIGDGMIAMDPNGRVSYLNKVAESLTGWKQVEASGRNVEEVFRIVNEETRQPVENPALLAMRDGRIVGMNNHTLLITRSGVEIPIDDSGAPMKTPQGAVFGAVLIFRDITERRRAETEREILAKQTRMLDSGFDAIIVRDSGDRVISWNRVAEQLYGWSADEASGRVTHELFNTIFPKPRDEIARDLHRDNRWEGELIRTRKDGSSVTVLSHWILDRDAQGQPRSVLEINIDISAHKRAEEALREQREWFRVTLSSIGDAVIATDTKGVVTLLNPVAESLTGWKQQDAAGQPLERVFRIVNERTRREVENPALRAIREGAILGLSNHTVLIARNGTETPIDDAGSPIRDADGKTVGAVLIFRDVMVRRRADRMQAELFERERLARQSEREARETAEAAELRLKLALDGGRLGTWEYSIAAGKVLCSPGFEQIHGYQPGTFPGTFEAFRDEIHPEDRDRVIIAIREAIDQQRDHHIEYRIVRKDGSVRWLEGRGCLFLDNQQSPDRMIGVCVDVTERRQAAEADNQARLAAEEANRTKDEFLAMLSHELRNPLSSILGWTSVLKSGQMPLERATQALEVIERNARLEAQLVESLLDLSRIAAGKLQLDSERIELAALLRSVVDSQRPAADAKGIDLQISTETEVVISGDSARLQQIFSNLLTNALKFTPRGGHVQVRLSCVASNAQIQVADDGGGIDSDLLPHIFDRFRQGESTKGRSHGGLGLGLAIVRELVQAHGGSVLAESPGRGRGSTFTVTMPIPAVIPAHIEAAGSRLLHTRDASISGLRVLVVDDDVDARELIGLTLESRGVRVHLVTSAGEALESISHDKPDVMIADIGMPQQDGYALIQTVRALEREHSHTRLPAIALTAYASTTDRDQALTAGYDLHLAKPVGPADLTQALAAFRRTKQHGA